MGRITSKYGNLNTVGFADFSGGINTSNAEEMIAPNELSKCINMELDASTGLLKTVAGTVRVFTDDKNFRAFFWDGINECFILTNQAGEIFKYDDELAKIGELTGLLRPAFSVWEDGVIIASGGKLQYWNGTAVVDLANSPEHSNGVFVANGRVITWFDDILYFSSVGDEETWAEISDDDSSGKWIEVGYKDGGAITGVVNLSSDILIVKSNSHAYHLAGDYPNWVLKEISRSAHSKGERSCIAVGNEALVLGDFALQSISTTADYGDMRLSDISKKVKAEIYSLPKGTTLKYIPALNQIWIITGKRRFMFLDVATGGYFERKFTNEVYDALSVDDVTYVLKENGICKLQNDSPEDDGTLIEWQFHCKTNVADNRYLVKRVRFDVTPDTNTRYDCNIFVGHLGLAAAMPRYASSVYGDKTTVYHSPREVYEPHAQPEYNNSEDVYDSTEEIYGSDMPLVVVNMYRADVRCCQKLSSVRTRAQGHGGQFMINSIKYDVVEVL